MSGVIDAHAFHDWPSKHVLGPYMTRGWRELMVDRPEVRTSLRASTFYTNPQGNKALEAYPAKGVPGSDRALLSEQLFAGGAVARVVLGYDEAIFSTAHPLVYVARTVTQAANDWTAEEWLARDERLHGVVLVSNQLPDQAAAEIRRAGRNPRFVAVAMGANGMGKAFGHPVYHPIYEAAAEMGLPIIVQVGSDTAACLATPPIAGGMAATYGEYRALGAQVLASHAASMIVQGVFTMYPTLKVLLLGGGVSWVPAFLWRLNYFYKSNEFEAPWLKALPSEYFHRHISVSTYGLEVLRKAESLIRALQTVPWFGRSLLYASGYPNVDWERPDTVVARLPTAWREDVLRGNAERFFRWPGGAARPMVTGDRTALLERT